MINLYRYHVGQFNRTFTSFCISGPDSFSFLQSQTTFDIKLILDNFFHLVSFLDPQGRIDTYGWLLRLENGFKFLAPHNLGDLTNERLHRFLISEDVTIEPSTEEKWQILIGPEAINFSSTFTYEGVIFDEQVFIQQTTELNEAPEIEETVVEQWRLLTGWPSFDGKDFKKELINNHRLFDLSVSNKGCYPGQETVSKIATRRGAAYSPVLIETNQSVSPGLILNFEKKIGEASHCLSWDNKYYTVATLLRDFRVQSLILHFKSGGSEQSGKIVYYPLLSGSNVQKAKELFYAASDDFKDDKLLEAEEKLRHAIKLDPTFADAYESLGVMLGRIQRYPEAIELMQMLAKVDEHSVLAHTNMSMFLMKLGKIEEAEQQKSLATLKSFQKFGEEAKQKQAEETSQKQKETEWASRESMFRQVLEIDQEDSLANYGLGSIAVEKGLWLQAQIHLETVLNTDPAYSVAYLALGKAYKGLGKKEQAKKIWLEGIKVAATKGDLMPANQMQFEVDNL